MTDPTKLSGVNSRLALLFIIVAVCVSTSGCSTYRAEREAASLRDQGKLGDSILIFKELAERNPRKYTARYVSERERVTSRLLLQADASLLKEETEQAKLLYQEILIFDPGHLEAKRGLEKVARYKKHVEFLEAAKQNLANNDKEQAMSLLSRILSENSSHAGALSLKGEIIRKDTGADLFRPNLSPALNEKVSLEFKDASVQSVFEVIAKSANINFIFDQDLDKSIRTTIYAHNTSIADALSLIMKTSQLEMKALNDNTFLIFPDSKSKESIYQDLVVKSYFLTGIDAGKMQNMIRSIVSPKSMYIDDDVKLLVVRDTINVIEVVDRLVEAYDLIAPEVELEVQIFEVSDDNSLNLGIQYPDSISASVSGSAGVAGQLTVNEIQNLNRDNFTLFVPDPLAVLNFKQTSGQADTLANPRIRVKNKEQAEVLIGDKVPVITTTVNQSSSATTESVSYLDVGLKLKVEPEVHVNDDVSIDINLEVSNIVKEIRSTTGLLVYQIGTRSASTVLRLKDGETQMLAGLIRDEKRDSASHFPIIGRIPGLGRFFSNSTDSSLKSEIVLLITPHIKRGVTVPRELVTTFSSGTYDKVSTKAFRLDDVSAYGDRESLYVNDAEVGSEAGLDNALAPNPLSVVMPTQIDISQDLIMSLFLKNTNYSQLEFDLVHQGEEMTFIGAGSYLPELDYNITQDGDAVHVELSGDFKSDGRPLLSLRFKPRELSAGEARFTFEGASAVSDGKKTHFESGAAGTVNVR